MSETESPRIPLDRDAAVTARFFPSKFSKSQNRQFNTIDLGVAYANGANKAWASSTPSGSITLNLGDNPAADWFEAALDAGDDIHVTFTRHDRGE